MIYAIVAFYDEEMQRYTNPRFVISPQSAVRDFDSAIQSANAKQEGLLFSHASDYSLWQIGEFDDVLGKVKEIHPERLVKGSDF